MSEGEEYPGFAPEDDVPIPYMRRIRDYYRGLGYGAAYRWAHYAEVPFQPLKKPLAECRIALITTAAPYQPGKGDQGPGAPYNAAAKSYSVYSGDAAVDHDLRISHLRIRVMKPQHFRHFYCSLLGLVAGLSQGIYWPHATNPITPRLSLA
jgi:hypothetical protein